MKLIIFSLLHFASFLQFTFSKDLYPDLDFDTCGTPSGTLEFIRVSSCESFPCTLRKGEPILVEIIFIPSFGDSMLSVDVSGIVAGLEIPWPGIDKDACKFLVDNSCPFPGSNRLHYAANMTIAPTYPNLQLVTGQWKIQNKDMIDHICMRLRIKVASPTNPTATTQSTTTTTTNQPPKQTTLEESSSSNNFYKSIYIHILLIIFLIISQ